MTIDFAPGCTHTHTHTHKWHTNHRAACKAGFAPANKERPDEEHKEPWSDRSFPGSQQRVHTALFDQTDELVK